MYPPYDSSTVGVVRVAPGRERNHGNPLVLARRGPVVTVVGTTAAVSFPLGSVVIVGSHVMPGAGLVPRMISRARTALNQ